KDELERHVETFLLEEAKLDGGGSGEIGIGDQVGNGDLHHLASPLRNRQDSMTSTPATTSLDGARIAHRPSNGSVTCSTVCRRPAAASRPEAAAARRPAAASRPEAAAARRPAAEDQAVAATPWTPSRWCTCRRTRPCHPAGSSLRGSCSSGWRSAAPASAYRRGGGEAPSAPEPCRSAPDRGRRAAAAARWAGQGTAPKRGSRKKGPGDRT